MKLILICLLINQNIHYSEYKPKILYIPYYQSLTNEEIISKLEITESYEKYEFNIKPTFFEVGTKDYILYALKNDGSQDIYDFKINIYDDVPPIINGPNIIYLKDKIEINTIINSYHSYDEVDGRLNTFIEETNYNVESNKSNYYIRFFCEDKSKNITKKYVKIYIENKDYSFYVSNNPSISITKNNRYYIDDIIKILINEKQLENINYDKKEFYNSSRNYFISSSTGIFNEEIFLKYNNYEKVITLTINVIDEIQKEKPLIIKLFDYIIQLIKEYLS